MVLRDARSTLGCCLVSESSAHTPVRWVLALQQSSCVYWAIRPQIWRKKSQASWRKARRRISYITFNERGRQAPGAVSALTACAEPSGYFRNVILMVSIKRS